jgi:eukaryotic-like serine/threonine-protein kinase
MDIERLGPYQIVGELGRGGMGAVYKAVHSETGEAAAVKLLSPHLAHEEGFRSRFEAEIETLRKLNHPNIVRLFGFGEQEAYLFYAMELVDGSSLEQELRQGRRFDWREVARIASEMCLALRHAHDRGVIHRDIKPGNVLLAADGRLKLSDFGIARLFGYSRLTGAGNVLGTAEYMAPEQAEGRPVDYRADLYSLGALMYALLARRPLFRGKSLPDMLYKQRFEQPEPIRSLVPDLPDDFERIIGQLLEKEPERRIPNAAVVGRRLDVMLKSLSVAPETLQADAGWFQGSRSGEQPAPLAPPMPTEVVMPAARMDDMAATLDLSRPMEVPSQELQAELPVQPPPLPEAEEGKTRGGGVTAPVAAPVAKTPEPTAGESATTTAAAPPAAKFVVVSRDELDRDDEEERPPMFSLQTGVLVLALLALGVTVWWFLQPPSAEALYRRIQAKTADRSIDSLRQAADDIRDYLDRFSTDINAPELRRFEREIELDDLQRKFNLMVKRSSVRDRLPPIEQAYLEAMNYLQLDPEVGAAKLQAIVDLYEQTGDEGGSNELCLVLARRRLTQIDDETEKRAGERLKLLEQRLKTAGELREKEPEQAAAMYRAIVELYSRKPWAAGVVRRARDELEKLKKLSPAKK